MKLIKNIKKIEPLPFILTGLLFALIFLVLVWTSSGLPDALTCESIDKFLEDDMLGKIDLTDYDKQILLDGMDWCIKKGYQVNPLNENLP